MKMGTKMGEKVSFADFDELDELTVCRRLAKQIVENVIEKATEEVSKQVQFEIKSTKFTTKRPASLQLNSLTPSIQIDLVPSRTPTPEEQDNKSWIEQQQATNKQKKRKIRVKIIEEDEEDLESSKKQQIIENKQSQIVSTNKKKKTSVCWTDNSASDEGNEKRKIKTQFNECTFNDKNNNLKHKNEQIIMTNQISMASNDPIDRKVNSIKFNPSPSELINGYHKNEKILNQNNYSKSPKTTRFDDKEETINWPHYDDHELNCVASRFVQQIIEDATREVERKLKPSTSRSSGLYIEDKTLKSNYQPWSLNRIKEILTKIMRSTCLCGPKHSNTSSSIAEHV